MYVAVWLCAAMYGTLSQCRTLHMLKLYATWYLTSPVQHNDSRESSGQFWEAQVISSSLDGRTVTCRLAQSGRWSSALITLSSAVLPLSLTTTTFPVSLCCVCI